MAPNLLSSLGLLLSDQPDAGRLRALTAWTRDILGLPESARISVHELSWSNESVPFLTSIVGVHSGNWNWFFTFTHSKEIVTKRALQDALRSALERDFG